MAAALWRERAVESHRRYVHVLQLTLGFFLTLSADLIRVAASTQLQPPCEHMAIIFGEFIYLGAPVAVPIVVPRSPATHGTTPSSTGPLNGTERPLL